MEALREVAAQTKRGDGDESRYFEL